MTPWIVQIIKPQTCQKSRQALFRTEPANIYSILGSRTVWIASSSTKTSTKGRSAEPPLLLKVKSRRFGVARRVKSLHNDQISGRIVSTFNRYEIAHSLTRYQSKAPASIAVIPSMGRKTPTIANAARTGMTANTPMDFSRVLCMRDPTISLWIPKRSTT